MSLQGEQYARRKWLNHKAMGKEIGMAEPAVVVWKRVMIVEPRVGR